MIAELADLRKIKPKLAEGKSQKQADLDYRRFKNWRHLAPLQESAEAWKPKGFLQNLCNAVFLSFTAALKLTPKHSDLKQPFCFAHSFIGQELRKGSAGQVISDPHSIRWGSWEAAHF